MKNFLISQLKKFDNAYYNESAIISDEEYDRLKEKAKKENPDHEYFQTVGSPVKKSKFKLPYILGSLNKFKTEKEFNKWYEPEKTYIAEEKIDGLSIYIEYFDNVLKHASTRGDGNIGQDITDKAKFFCPTPKNNRGKLEIRGEVILPGNFHLTLGKKTRRNACSGIINQKSTEHCDKLIVRIYELIYSDDQSEKIQNSELERLWFLRNNFGKLTLPKIRIFKPNQLTYKKLIDMLNYWKSDCANQYDIDGIVLIEKKSKRENIYYPKKKIAFKKDEQAVSTTVINCKWKTSRLGKIKPVLEIEPIIIQGVEIRYVTAHNFEYVRDNCIYFKTKVDIKRSGDVIPYITNVYKHKTDSEHFTCDICPSCHSDIYKHGVDLICINKLCEAQTLRRITHFFSTLEVEYMSEKTIDNLMQELNLHTIEDFYNLKSKDLEGIKGFGSKKIKKIIDEIEKSKNCKPENLLAAFGIDGIGKTNAKNILNYYSFNDLFNLKDISKINGIGNITNDKFVEGLLQNKSLYEFLKENGLSFQKKLRNNKLENIIFTLTGKGNLKRKDYIEKIENSGGSVSGISNKTSYLVTDNINSNSGKTKKAKKLNIEIISYSKLESMIKNINSNERKNV